MPTPSHPAPPPHPEPPVVVVSVAYVGNNAYHHSYPVEATFGSIKLDAMAKFGLDPAAASKYALQYNGSDVGDAGHVGDLHQHKVDMELVLVEDVPKGSHVQPA